MTRQHVFCHDLPRIQSQCPSVRIFSWLRFGSKCFLRVVMLRSACDLKKLPRLPDLCSPSSRFFFLEHLVSKGQEVNAMSCSLSFSKTNTTTSGWSGAESTIHPPLCPKDDSEKCDVFLREGNSMPNAYAIADMRNSARLQVLHLPIDLPSSCLYFFAIFGTSSQDFGKGFSCSCLAGSKRNNIIESWRGFVVRDSYDLLPKESGPTGTCGYCVASGVQIEK